MKNLLASLALMTMMSCSNGNETKETDTPTNLPTTVVSPTEPVPVKDTGSASPPKEELNKPVFPIGTFKTLQEIMKRIFSEGSTKNEVRTVQGEPDFTETDGVYENWYYGRCLVQFKGPIVRAVKNTGGKLRYADYFSLAFSTDKIELEFYDLLNDRINRR